MYLKNLSINQTKQEHFAKGYNHFGQTTLCDYFSVVELAMHVFLASSFQLYLNIILLYYFLCMYIS